MSDHVGPHFVGEFSDHATNRTCPACHPPRPTEEGPEPRRHSHQSVASRDACETCSAEVARRAALSAPTPEAAGLRDLPDRVIVDQHGHYWRDYGDFLSMCPVSDENNETITTAVYVPENTPDRKVLTHWWTDGAMVNAGDPGDEGFVGDAATEDDATRIVEAHNAAFGVVDRVLG